MFTLTFNKDGGQIPVNFNYGTSEKQCTEELHFDIPQKDNGWLRVTGVTSSSMVVDVFTAFTTVGGNRTSDITVRVGNSETCTDGGENTRPHRKIHIVQNGPTS